MVVWTGTAGTRSNWRNMQRTVVRKQRQRVGHRGASWPPADAASADASNRTRHHHHTGVTIMAPHFLLDYVHSFFFWAASAQCQQDRAMPRTCRATTATGSLVFFLFFFCGERTATCSPVDGGGRTGGRASPQRPAEELRNARGHSLLFQRNPMNPKKSPALHPKKTIKFSITE